MNLFRNLFGKTRTLEKEVATVEHNTSLIITKEYSTFYEKLVHFRIDDYYIIPVKADSIQYYLIDLNSENGEELEEVFEKTIDQLYSTDLVKDFSSTQDNHPRPLYQDLYDFENLLLIEVIQKLKLKNFELYHFAGNPKKPTSVYWDEFVDGVLDYYACEKYMNHVDDLWSNPKFNSKNYPNYDFCKEKYLKTKANNKHIS